MQMNETVLFSLPDEDAWPFLSRSMFAITPVAQSYDCRLIHFAASMKGIEEAWPEWLGKFEALLRRMSWVSAAVYLSTENFGDHRYWWAATDPMPGGPVTLWDTGGGPRNYDEFLRLPPKAG
jgi:hypothetical protein